MKIKFLCLCFMICSVVAFAGCESKGKKILCKVENLKEKISDLKSEGTYNVIVTGTISNNKKFLDDLAAALKQDRTVKIHLDLSESEGLKEFYSGASNLLGVSLPPSFKKLSTKSFRGKNIKYVDFPKGNERFIAEGNAIYTKNHKILGAVLAGATELNVAEGTEGITFDESKYQVTVTVEENEEGDLAVVSTVITKKGASGTVNDMGFTNVYEPTDTPPQTGDITLWISLAVVLLGAIAVMGKSLYTQKKRRVED